MPVPSETKKTVLFGINDLESIGYVFSLGQSSDAVTVTRKFSVGFSYYNRDIPHAVPAW